jgi:hypothetical protein
MTPTPSYCAGQNQTHCSGGGVPHGLQDIFSDQSVSRQIFSIQLAPLIISVKMTPLMKEPSWRRRTCIIHIVMSIAQRRLLSLTHSIHDNYYVRWCADKKNLMQPFHLVSITRLRCNRVEGSPWGEGARKHNTAATVRSEVFNQMFHGSW